MDKNRSGLFYVAIGASDGAEVCRLGNFLLYKLSEKYKRKNLALYPDDGLAILRISADQTQKKLKNIFVNCLENMTLNFQLNAIENLGIYFGTAETTFKL